MEVVSAIFTNWVDWLHGIAISKVTYMLEVIGFTIAAFETINKKVSYVCNLLIDGISNASLAMFFLLFILFAVAFISEDLTLAVLSQYLQSDTRKGLFFQIAVTLLLLSAFLPLFRLLINNIGKGSPISGLGFIIAGLGLTIETFQNYGLYTTAIVIAVAFIVVITLWLYSLAPSPKAVPYDLRVKKRIEQRRFESRKELQRRVKIEEIDE